MTKIDFNLIYLIILRLIKPIDRWVNIQVCSG